MIVKMSIFKFQQHNDNHNISWHQCAAILLSHITCFTRNMSVYHMKTLFAIISVAIVNSFVDKTLFVGALFCGIFLHNIASMMFQL